MERGDLNMIEDRTKALAHFGKERTRQCLMVRLDVPETNEGAKAAGK
jgi:hypothetical protein